MANTQPQIQIINPQIGQSYQSNAPIYYIHPQSNGQPNMGYMNPTAIYTPQQYMAGAVNQNANGRVTYQALPPALMEATSINNA